MFPVKTENILNSFVKFRNSFTNQFIVHEQMANENSFVLRAVIVNAEKQ